MLMRKVLTEAEHGSGWAATQSVANKIGCTEATLHKWVAHAERDAGQRAGLTTTVARCTVETWRATRRSRRENAMAESVIGLFETEVNRRRGPWRHVVAVELATLECVHQFNTQRLLEPIGYPPPAELELILSNPESSSDGR